MKGLIGSPISRSIIRCSGIWGSSSSTVINRYIIRSITNRYTPHQTSNTTINPYHGIITSSSSSSINTPHRHPILTPSILSIKSSHVHTPTTNFIINRQFSNSSSKYNQTPITPPPKKSITDTLKSSATTITKASLLAQANSSLSRLLIHLKWPLIRGKINHHSTIDIISAFISWLVMGNILWIILGTTTFGLVFMYSIHYFDHFYDTFINQSQGSDSSDVTSTTKKGEEKGVLRYLTNAILSYGLGIKIQFQKGNILPELKDGKLRFKNFTVVSKDEKSFIARVEAVDLTLSFNKWYEGNGIIGDLEIFGMNGKIYKSNNDHQNSKPLSSVDKQSTTITYRNHFENIHYQYDLQDLEEVQQTNQHHQHQHQHTNKFMDSNYKLDHVKIHDSYLEIYNNQDQNQHLQNPPMRITIFNCDLPRLSGDKILIDFFNANNSSGLINDSMFTIHKRQDFLNMDSKNFSNDKNNSDDKLIRFKLDSIDLGSLSQSNPFSKFNWIINGKAEIIADIKLPNIDKIDNHNSESIISDFFNELLRVTRSDIDNTIPQPQTSSDSMDDDSTLLKGALTALYQTFTKPQHDITNQSEYVMVNVKVKFYDLKASLPKNLPMSNSNNIPFISLQDLRSLIGFINNYNDETHDHNEHQHQHTTPISTSSTSMTTTSPADTTTNTTTSRPIIIKTTVIEKITDLYHINNLSQTKIFDSIISDIYEDLLKVVKQDEKRIIHEKSSMWSHSLASQLLLLGLGVIV
ncbi:putative mitochondrial distribution and morphology protein, mitochondrial precursor [Scheffersomyces coipomensis]|uniref:putative mitochondrial distribution and morphology protein, mitochondrial precursor n=1 Tax=Scheffersomyces coipomensis TaxID=1788519 RepID=UPI00315D636D